MTRRLRGCSNDIELQQRLQANENLAIQREIDLVDEFEDENQLSDDEDVPHMFAGIENMDSGPSTSTGDRFTPQASKVQQEKQGNMLSRLHKRFTLVDGW